MARQGKPMTRLWTDLLHVLGLRADVGCPGPALPQSARDRARLCERCGKIDQCRGRSRPADCRLGDRLMR